MKIKSWQKHEEDVVKVRRWIDVASTTKTGIARDRGAKTLSHCVCGFDKAAEKNVSMADLDAILGMDEELSAVWVEPGVTMRSLTCWALAQGMVPPVVPEFKGITVGGAVMGGAIESSSFRYGQFNDTCKAYELVLDDGALLCASQTKFSDLFYGVSASYGTLASMTAALVQLVPAKPFVHVRYHCLESPDDLPYAIDQLASQPDVRYLDGVFLDETNVVLMTGEEIEAPAKKIEHLCAFWHPWFIQLIKNRVRSGVKEDFFSLKDYLFRWDRAAFWMGQFCTRGQAFTRYITEWNLKDPRFAQKLHAVYRSQAPQLDPSLFLRALLGWKLSSRSLYRILHTIPKQHFARTFIVQDFYIPFEKLMQFVRFVQEQAGIYPLWLCPIKGTETPQILSAHLVKGKSRAPKADFVNVGIYGIPKEDHSVQQLTRGLESYAHQLGAKKMFYAQNLIPEEEFWSVYDHSAYQHLRALYTKRKGQKEIYEKITM